MLRVPAFLRGGSGGGGDQAGAGACPGWDRWARLVPWPSPIDRDVEDGTGDDWVPVPPRSTAAQRGRGPLGPLRLRTIKTHGRFDSFTVSAMSVDTWSLGTLGGPHAWQNSLFIGQ
ncbi:hypothetical protein NDU88_005319 [Pleurodeles waltl]|uniref:Uncharacterized protein n=1 Tax=Pleurodeles waltl TaxID=8319 RepID=A0AAV7SLI2_PLEWA|nr:hypothetical protein NDU88_005319 [Pleurodeles waltl]